MKSRGYTRFRPLFAVILVALVGGAFFGLDRVYGEVSGIGKVREDARKFRAEAAPLKMSTRSLVPDLQHTYGPQVKLSLSIVTRRSRARSQRLPGNT